MEKMEVDKKVEEVAEEGQVVVLLPMNSMLFCIVL